MISYAIGAFDVRMYVYDYILLCLILFIIVLHAEGESWVPMNEFMQTNWFCQVIYETKRIEVIITY